MVAFTGEVIRTEKVSSFSLAVSPITCTVTVLLITPGANVTVPFVET